MIRIAPSSAMDKAKVKEYERQFRNDPSAFVDGAASFCKQAGAGDLWSRIWPWLLALGGGYLSMKFGSGWGRYAQRTGNPNGPVKGPFMKFMEKMLPEGNKVVWPGQPEYDATLALRRAQDDYDWNQHYGNSVANGKANSLTMRTTG